MNKLPAFNGNIKTRWYVGNVKVLKGYQGTNLVYSVGNKVTYYVDNNENYVEEVDWGNSCLSPVSFEPVKTGWTFVGWREDNLALNSVLTDKLMGDNPVSLYAVFQKDITLTIYNGITNPAQQSGTRYYNNGTVANPKFSISPASINGWNFNGWCTSPAVDAAIIYPSINNTEFSDSTSVYSKYSQIITLTTYNDSSVPTAHYGTRYFNTGNYSNPRFTVTAMAKSGWNFNGWCTSPAVDAAIIYPSISNFELSANLTLYGKYSQTITLSYNGNGATSGNVETQSGTRYFNSGNYSDPSFVLASNGYLMTDSSFVSWSIDGATYNPGQTITLAANTVAYALWMTSIIHFQYVGNYAQTFTAPYTGKYKLEVWGAQGGSTEGRPGNGTGGLGGYSVGNVILNAGTVLYVVIGGTGFDANGSDIAIGGGYNGGGNSYYNAGGGGATHIGTRNLTLADYGDVNGLFIVAGGGGGGGSSHISKIGRANDGGHGGGINGETGFNYINEQHTVSGSGEGGTQLNGYAFGQGQVADKYQGGGGGGGLYGGYAGWNFDGGAGGGGGSGYIGGVTGGNTANGSRTGNGYAKITFLGT